MESLEIEL